MSDDSKENTTRSSRRAGSVKPKEEQVDREQENIKKIQEALEKRADLFLEEAEKESEIKRAEEEGYTKVELREPAKNKWLERLKKLGVLAGTFALIAIGRSSKYPKPMSFYKAERDLAKGAIDFARGKNPPEQDSSKEKKTVTLLR